MSGCVTAKTGWTPVHLTLWDEDTGELRAAMPNYLKSHSYGEYFFDWAWASAYKEHGIEYYPKLLCAIPFTPVSGDRLLGSDSEAKSALTHVLKEFAFTKNISSIHVLFPPDSDLAVLKAEGFMQRESIQFHWKNESQENPETLFKSFDEFLLTLNKKRRKNIKHEREFVRNQGVRFEHLPGLDIKPDDWDFFYACYENTYFNHGSSPYLNIEFFKQLQQSMPQYLHLMIAHHSEQKIAASLIFRNRNDYPNEVAYGRYWGSLVDLPNLHFETSYYQAFEFCIAEGISTFEGGAQGEHKIHRGMLPVNLHSAHYIGDSRFAKAIDHFLTREEHQMNQYMSELESHLPIKKTSP